MPASADSSVPTTVLFYDHAFLIFFFIFFPFILCIRSEECISYKNEDFLTFYNNLFKN